MPDWPSALTGSLHSTVGDVSASSRGTVVTASATPNTKGSYAELISATPIDGDGFWLRAAGAGVAVADLLIDIAIGAAGSEVVILENVLFSGGANFSSFGEAYVPLPIKAGTRVAARCQSTDASLVVHMTVHICSSPFYASLRKGRATTYGAATGDSGGVNVDPGAVAHTKGSWAEIVASLTNPIEYAIICIGNQNNGARADSQHLLDIGVGAGGSEQIVLDDLYLRDSSQHSLVMPQWSNRAFSAKAGERLAARQQCLLTDATDRLVDVVVVGFD